MYIYNTNGWRVMGGRGCMLSKIMKQPNLDSLL